jgi:phosphatidylglycerol lysyltransferase
VNQRRDRKESPTPEILEARNLVLEYGWNATAYQILNPGFTLWFSKKRDAVIGYVCQSRTRVVGGAPICESSRVQEVAAEFLDDARRNGQKVCFFGAGARLEGTLVGGGSWSAASLGAQPSWNPANWDGIIGARASLRAQLNRARNKKVTVTLVQEPDHELLAKLKGCLAEWLATRGLPPLHFLVEPDTLALLDDRLLMVASRNGVPIGFLVASPVRARNGWLIEQIVRGFGAPNGTAELMIDAAMCEMSRRGATYATLGLSPLSRHSGFDEHRMPHWLRVALAWLRAHGTRFYNFNGLDAFKSKFAPEDWEDIVALADAPKFPPRALWAIACAFTDGSPIVLVARASLRAIRQELRWLVAGRAWLRSSRETSFAESLSRREAAARGRRADRFGKRFR